MLGIKLSFKEKIIHSKCRHGILSRYKERTKFYIISTLDTDGKVYSTKKHKLQTQEKEGSLNSMIYTVN